MTEELTCPLTGECVDLTSIDDLAACLGRVKEVKSQLTAVETQIRERFAELAKRNQEMHGESGKTVRLRGDLYRVKITLPSDKWDKWGALRELYLADPLSRNYLAIETVKPIGREVNKLKNEHGGEAFEAMREKLFAANQGPQGLPSVSIEEGDE